jgi:RimJ/RimL family protein N-acetyltransferase
MHRIAAANTEAVQQLTAERESRHTVDSVDNQVTLRPVVESDLDLLGRLFTDPAAAGDFEWYGWQDGRWLRRKWEDNGLLGEDGGTLMTERAGETLGFVSWRKRHTWHRAWCWAIGVKVIPEARGRGHGTQAQRALVRYLFSHTQATRIEAETEVMNIAEQRALEKAGFTWEGVLRSVVFRAGQWRDGMIYSVLRDEVVLDPAGAITEPVD